MELKLEVDLDSTGPSLQLVRAQFSNFLFRKLSCDFKLRGMTIIHDLQMAIFRYCVMLQSDGWHGTGIVYADMTLTRSKVKVMWWWPSAPFQVLLCYLVVLWQFWFLVNNWFWSFSWLPVHSNGQATIFCSCAYFLSSFSLPILSIWTLDVYHTSTHDVALVQI